MFLLTKILATRYMQSYIKKQKLRKKEIKQLCQYILPAPLSLNVQMSCFKTSPTFLHSICLECLDSLIKNGNLSMYRWNFCCVLALMLFYTTEA